MLVFRLLRFHQGLISRSPKVTRGSAEPLVTWKLWHSWPDYVVHGPYGTMYLYNTYVTVLIAGWFRWQSCDVTVTCSSLSTSVSWAVTKCSPARLGHTGSLADRRSTESRCCLENSPYRPTNMPLEGPRFSSELVKRYVGNSLTGEEPDLSILLFNCRLIF